MRTKKIVVIGLGYIGLPTATILAAHGYTVVGVDKKASIVAQTNDGICHIDEPSLANQLRLAVSSGKLIATTSLVPGDVYIISVPTPLDHDSQSTQSDPSPDMTDVISVTNALAAHLKDGDLVVLESTSPVGTTVRIKKMLGDFGVNVDKLRIAYCPERVLPGDILRELLENDRIVGGVDAASSRDVANFYRTFVKGIVTETTSDTAEMVKLTENSFRDVNIAFANELSMLCSQEGMDVREVIQLANRHPRVEILEPGIGVGGHCIPVDPWFIVARDKQNSNLIRTARMVNKKRRNGW